MSLDPISFIHDLTFDAIPKQAQDQALLNLLDLVGVGFGGATLRASQIARDVSPIIFGGTQKMLFDGRLTSPAGCAYTTATTIDALDGHDGFNPAKGHAGCGVFAAAIAFAQATDHMNGHDFITAITIGYELACRLAMSLHASAPDYHTSGAWVAIAAAALGARSLKLDDTATNHALGIAEYHGPRSQMMRCIDHPTMVKDGSGWGAMAGVTAAFLAQAGFTGAPAITLGNPPEFWADLGARWLICEQYHKPYPVCRWAQAPIEGVLALRRAHNITAADVDHIEVETFHEAVRLATSEPQASDAAQYSTSFAAAIALVHGTVTAADIADDAMQHPEILRFSKSLVMRESDKANVVFPGTRIARVKLVLHSGTVLQGDWMQPRWDADAPATDTELRQKFHSLADPAIGQTRAKAVETTIANLPKNGLAPLLELITQPISA